jgi:ParB-like chromosome segregation protein Spo0J
MFPDRILDLRRVPASSLLPDPRNWRRHPPRQRAALVGVLSEIGFADALLARELPDGRLQLIDGHLRAQAAPDQLVPVLVLDVNASEAAKLLASLDPLAALAEADAEKLDELLAQFQTDSADLAAMLDELAESARAAKPASEFSREPEIPEVWQVVVNCRSEEEQRRLFERLTEQGYDCRVLMM